MDEVTPQDYKRLRRIEIARRARALNYACFRNQKFLSSERSCRWLADSVTRALAKHNIDLWAYCFLPTHVHLLVFPKPDKPNIAAFLSSHKKSVTNKAIAWVTRNAPGFLVRMRDEQPNGDVSFRFWQRGGGYDRNLWSAEAIWNMIDYIHRNPVEEGLCEHPSDWKWSSAGTYKDGREGPLKLERRHLRQRPS